ncbi:Telomeric repeat-binding factor 2-interacting protein 1, partial [Stegodyphus mimosarum]
MSEFVHSIVLFSAEDGSPLEFNIRSVNEKLLLKSMIEHGGGMCSHNENAIHLISPGTKVLNVDLNKKLVSTKYVFDCVKLNYLLDINDYLIKISEAETSDISDEDSAKLLPAHLPVDKEMPSEGCVVHSLDKEPVIADNNGQLDLPCSDVGICTKNKDSALISDAPDVIFGGSSLELTCCDLDVSNHNLNRINHQALDIKSSVTTVDESANSKSAEIFRSSNDAQDEFSKAPVNCLQDPGNKSFIIDSSEDEIRPTGPVYDGVNPLGTVIDSGALGSDNQLIYNKDSNENLKDNIYVVTVDQHIEQKQQVSPVAVSSSQPENDPDDFDKLLLSKAQNAKTVEEEEDAQSQSYTVSSSADAQVGSKPSSCEINSAEVLGAGSTVPDSAMPNAERLTERQLYMQNLEAEVERILRKPSPKSIQDKICLVKYICCLKRLPPDVVLQSLQNR